MRWRALRRRALILALGSAAAALAQTESGTLRGVVVNGRGTPLAGIEIRARGVPAASIAATRSNLDGSFEFRLPYGEYRLAAGAAAAWSAGIQQVEANETTCVRLDANSARAATVACPRDLLKGPAWSAPLPRSPWPETFSVEGLLLNLEPSTVTQPLNLTGLTPTPLSLVSQRGLTWTGTAYRLQGADVTDPYQPGTSVVLADPAALQEVSVRSGASVDAEPAYGSEIGLLLRSFPEAWHTRVETSDAGSFLASSNLAPATALGLVEQSQRYRWFTRDHVDTAGPAGQRLALFVSGTRQWAAQTVPFRPPGSQVKTGLLLGNARARCRLTDRDRLEGLFSGAGIDLSDGGTPAGIEGLLARRGGPALGGSGPPGFPGTPERDRFNHAAATWTHTLAAGEIKARFGLSSVRLDTMSSAPAGAQSSIDLLAGITNGVSPLASTGNRTVLDGSASYQAAPRSFGTLRHVFAAGIEWEDGFARNRLTVPSNLNLITADGAPAFVLMLNTPVDAREHTRMLRAYLRDEAAIRSWLSVNVGIVADGLRGVTPDAISWGSVSPRAGIAATPGRFRRVALRAGYARLYSPLAGRYLDYSNPKSLGGIEYQWLDRNGDGRYQSGELGPAISTFGGLYASIDPHLGRPYADEFHVGAEAALPWNISARLSMFRRDDRQRLAAMDTGVPPQAFTPVRIDDPGPDGMAGTFDDQALTVYAQNPATLGMDRYLLTNPAGLRQREEAMTAELAGGWGAWRMHASFLAVKSQGPANPGNTPFQNDPGVIGSLLMDPNTSIYAAGRAYFDRAYVGKLQLLGRLPAWLGSLDWANTVVYTDGLPFARMLLVNGLPQGPIVVQASPHGAPGGNRAEYVLNWNTRISRTFARGGKTLRLGIDGLNAANIDNRIQEIDASGSTFHLRLPAAIQAARFFRLFAELGF